MVSKPLWSRCRRYWPSSVPSAGPGSASRLVPCVTVRPAERVMTSTRTGWRGSRDGRRAGAGDLDALETAATDMGLDSGDG